MVEDGTLQEIIGDYLNATAVWGFDTVADMKASANLIDGSFACTLGYHAKNDGGAGLYKIRNVTNDDVVDEATIIEIGDDSNELIAELVLGDSINAKQFGAKGDNTTDDTLKLQNLINKGQLYKKRVILNDGYYKVSGLSITSPVTIECVEQTAKLISISDAIPVITINQTGAQTLYERTVISGIEIDANGQEGIHISSGNVRVDKNTRILNASYGINVAGGNLYADDIRVEYCTTGIKISTSDNHLNNITTHNCATHYRNYGGFNICKNIHGWNFNENDTDYVSGAEFMRVNTAQTQIINCYVDTLPKAFIVENTTSPYICIDIQNLNFFLNVTSYPNTQAKPELINSFAGKININSCLIDYNGYVGDGTGNVFSYPSNVRITNFASNGVRFDQNYYYKTEITPSASYTDDGSDFIINNSTYLSGNYRKLIADGNSRFLDLKFNLKKELSANTEIYNATCKHKMAGLDGMLLSCYAYSGSTYYPLQAFIEDNTLHIYNAGSSISSATAVQLRGILQKV